MSQRTKYTAILGIVFVYHLVKEFLAHNNYSDAARLGMAIGGLIATVALSFLLAAVIGVIKRGEKGVLAKRAFLYAMPIVIALTTYGGFQ